MYIKKITIEDKEKLDLLIQKIDSTMENKFWWLPISSTSYDNYFNDEWTYFLGIYDEKDNLVGASALFFNENEYGDTLKMIGKSYDSIAEIGRSMVLKEYRGHNYLFELNNKLIEIAKSKGIKRIIITIHPKNIASQMSFKKFGINKIATITKLGNYDRDVYILEI